ncbi:MAG: PorT family protein [Prevotella sp.]|nr:PorT family protein [Prevotella sp.]
MKKLMMIAAMMVAAMSANAQNEVGQFTLQPKVGINLANLTDLNDNKMRVGVVAGVEAEYGVAESFGVTAGLFYSMQGCKFKDAETEKHDYINIPIMAQYYVIPGLALKAGIQPGFLVSGKYGSENIKDELKKFDMSIPVGVSYEYQSFVFDARYLIGLTKHNKEGDRSNKNSVFQFTIGYKFAL